MVLFPQLARPHDMKTYVSFIYFPRVFVLYGILCTVNANAGALGLDFRIAYFLKKDKGKNSREPLVDI